MLMRLLGQNKVTEDAHVQRRRFERRSGDECAVEINGKMHPVINWSLGGLLFFGDERVYAANENINITMKFHMNDTIIPVESAGRVLRKRAGRIAVQFKDLTQDTRHAFQKVLDDIMSRAFTDSQA